MSVNIVHYRHATEVGWGVVRAGRIMPIPGDYPTTGDFVRNGRERALAIAAQPPAEAALREGDVEILSPITRNQQFICQAINYASHMRDSGIDPAQQPYNILFRKASSCIAPADTDIVRPAHVTLLDYEIELGLVIGREIVGPVEVTRANLHEFVAALVVVNDVSARDVQLPQGQFYKGKSYRTFGPTGPYLTLVDGDDLARLDELRLRLWVNDATRQDEYAAGLVFKPAPTLTELSGLQDLYPGDLLATGTPAGCAGRAPGKALMLLANLLPARVRWRQFIAMGQKNQRYLQPGDQLRASIRTDDGAIDLGEQRNRIVAP